MFRSRLALATVLAALGIIPAALTVSQGVAPAAPVPAHLFPKKEAEPDYFPVRVGNTWVYQVENWAFSEPFPFESKEVIDKVEDVDGARVVSIYTFWTAPGMRTTVNNYKLKIAPDGIFKMENGITCLDPPVCLLRRGGRSGDRWETNARRNPLYPVAGELEVICHGSETSSVTVGKLEPITVPAGTFQALRVEQTVQWHNFTKDGVVQSAYDEVVWYASGIGVVKSESSRRPYFGQTYMPPPCTSSLKSFTLGKE